MMRIVMLALALMGQSELFSFGNDYGPLVEVAEIVAGEAVPSYTGRLMVACNVLADIDEGISLSRWFGRKSPTSADLLAVRAALSGGCAKVPRCRYLGCPEDAAKWREAGLTWDPENVISHSKSGFAQICVTQAHSAESGPPTP